MKPDPQDVSPDQPRQVTFSEALAVWVRVALLSFGGSAGQIAVMHRLVVVEKKWLDETRFLHALNYCMLLPGPEAQQLATYLGWLLHGVRGGLVAGTLFILPGFLSILVLSIVYADFGHTAFVAGLFHGLKAAVVVIVLQAVWMIGRRALKTPLHVTVAVVAFLAIFAFGVPFPLIVLAAAGVGAVVSAYLPTNVLPTTAEDSPSAIMTSSDRRLGTTLAILVGGVGIWLLPAIFLTGWLGTDNVFVQEAWFFNRTAVVTFGGAYAVLAYIADAAVNGFGWLLPREMLDGLGLAETTPGPLIQVVQFVGYLGAYRNPGTLSPITAGVLGSLVTVWCTFAPCFVWIFAGAPHIERIRHWRRLNGAMSCITACVVGVILNLSIWFAEHAVFRTVRTDEYGPMSIPIPDWASLDVTALSLVVAAGFLLFVLRAGILSTLFATTVAGFMLRTL